MCIADRVLRQEAERQGEHDDVAHRTADVEEAAAGEERRLHALLLLGEQRRAHELPDLVHQVREHQHQRKPERGRDVREELRRHVDVDDVDVEGVIAEVGHETAPVLPQLAEPPVEEEAGIRRPEHERVEDVGHRDETPHQQDEQDDDDSKKGPSQSLEMVPE